MDVPAIPDLTKVVIETFVRSSRISPTIRALRLLERYSRPYRLPLEYYNAVFALVAAANTDKASLSLRLLDSLPREPDVITYNLVLSAVVNRWHKLDSTSLAHIRKLWNDMVAPPSSTTTAPYAFDPVASPGTDPQAVPPTRGSVRPDGRTYSCLIFGLVRLGELDAATRLWNHASAQGMGPEVKKDVLVLLGNALDGENRTDEAGKVYRWAWSVEDKSKRPPVAVIAEAFRRQRREEEEAERQGERLRLRTFLVGKRLLHDRRGDEPAFARVVEIAAEMEMELLAARGTTAAKDSREWVGEKLRAEVEEEEEEEAVTRALATVDASLVDGQLQA
jgi:pentatricopeptide repeat protein